MNNAKLNIDIAEIHTILKLSEYLAKSNLIPTYLQGHPENIMYIIKSGMELGFSPVESLRVLSVEKGVLTVCPRALLSNIKKSYANCKVVFTESPGVSVCQISIPADGPDDDVYRSGGPDDDVYRSEWTTARAKEAGLAETPSWKTYSRELLKWASFSEAMFAAFPCATSGVTINSKPFIMRADQSKGHVAHTEINSKGQNTGPAPRQNEKATEALGKGEARALPANEGPREKASFKIDLDYKDNPKGEQVYRYPYADK